MPFDYHFEGDFNCHLTAACRLAAQRAKGKSARGRSWSQGPTIIDQHVFARVQRLHARSPKVVAPGVTTRAGKKFELLTPGFRVWDPFRGSTSRPSPTPLTASAHQIALCAKQSSSTGDKISFSSPVDLPAAGRRQLALSPRSAVAAPPRVPRRPTDPKITPHVLP